MEGTYRGSGHTSCGVSCRKQNCGCNHLLWRALCLVYLLLRPRVREFARSPLWKGAPLGNGTVVTPPPRARTPVKFRKMRKQHRLGFFCARLSKSAIHANRHECKKVLRNNPGIKCIRA